MHLTNMAHNSLVIKMRSFAHLVLRFEKGDLCLYGVSWQAVRYLIAQPGLAKDLEPNWIRFVFSISMTITLVVV
jgi:hypothetical protein